MPIGSYGAHKDPPRRALFIEVPWDGRASPLTGRAAQGAQCSSHRSGPFSRLPWVVIAQDRSGRLKLEARQAQCGGEATPIEDEPLAPISTSVQPSDRYRYQRQWKTDRVQHDQVSATHAAHRFEAT